MKYTIAEHTLALDTAVYCIDNNSVTIYATISDDALKSGLCTGIIKNKIKDIHLFEIIITKDNQFNSINGKSTCFIDNHTIPIYEFIYDISTICNDITVWRQLVSTIDQAIVKTLAYVNKQFASFLCSISGIDSLNTGIEDLIEIESNMVKDTGGIPNTVKLTNYEHYMYRMSNFDDNQTSEHVNGINTNPLAKDSKVNEVLQRCFDLLLHNELDDIILVIEFETTTSVGDKFIAHSVFETNYILGDKVLCSAATYDKYDISEPGIVWYGKGNKEVEEEIANILYSTLKHIYKITSNLVDVTISYHIEKNEGVYV